MTWLRSKIVLCRRRKYRYTAFADPATLFQTELAVRLNVSADSLRVWDSGRMPRFLLFWVAVPALVLSVWLLHTADAPRSIQTLQVVMASVAAAVFVVLMSIRRVRPTGDMQ